MTFWERKQMYEKTGRYPVPVTRGRGGIRGRGRGFVPRGRGRGVGRFQSKRVFCFFVCVFFFNCKKIYQYIVTHQNVFKVSLELPVLFPSFS